MKRMVAILVAVVLTAGLLINAAAMGRSVRAAESMAGGRVIELPGPDLNVREYGGQGDRAIVLLHGYAGSIQWWQPVAEALAAEGRRVIAVDLVGHGGSEAPRETDPYGAAGQSSAVRQALAALGVSHAVLIGHSMGGGVAVAVAEADPALVDRVVIVDTLAEADLVAKPLLGRAACWPIVGPALDRLRGIRTFSESSLQTAFATGYPVPDFAFRSLERLTHVGFCDSDVLDDLDAERPVAERLAELGRPVLVIWGESDVLTPTAANVERYTAVGLPPRVIAGTGHSPMVENPDEFLSAIKGFVAPFLN